MDFLKFALFLVTSLQTVYSQDYYENYDYSEPLEDCEEKIMNCYRLVTCNGLQRPRMGSSGYAPMEYCNDDTNNFIINYNVLPIYLNYIPFNNSWKLNTILPFNRIKTIILSLQIQGTSYETTPTIPELPNLKSLDVSSNELVIAKLWNENWLPMLSKINLSNNNITIIETNGNLAYKNLTKINLSNNAIYSIFDGVFKPFILLQELNLSQNKIKEISSSAFEGLENLENLYLNINEIFNIGNSLHSFNKLCVLDLEGNKITNISKSLENLHSLEYLYLNRNNLKKIEANTFSHISTLIYLDLGSNQLQSIEESFTTMSSLDEINLHNNNLTSIPPGIFKGLRISAFYISGNSLEGPLRQNTFMGLTNVENLDLSNQKLTSIEDFAFVDLEKVTELKIDGNRIQHCSKDSFKGLISLEILDLSSNMLHNITFNTRHLPNLTALYMENNIIDKISRLDFDGLDQLRHLKLYSNNIQFIETGAFINLGNLISIDLENNPLKNVLESGTFSGLKSVPHLQLTYSLYSEISNGSFDGMNELLNLNLSHCNIQKLQYNTFINTGNIKSIDLSHNHIREFKVNISAAVNNLRKTNDETKKSLILSHNNLTYLDGDFTGLNHIDVSFNPFLRFNSSVLKNAHILTLNLISTKGDNVSFVNNQEVRVHTLLYSHSEILNVSALGLRYLNNLQSLTLSYNDIKNITSSDFENLKELIELDLSFNNITYIQPGSFLDNNRLIKLNISHNKLLAVSYGMLKGLHSLQTIDISYNRLDDLSIERFSDVPKLKFLIVDHNNIHWFHASNFEGLQALSIGDNPIDCKTIASIIRDNVAPITAIKISHTEHEHVDGIVCNRNHPWIHENKLPEAPPNTKILLEISEILKNQSVSNSNNVDKKFNEILSEIKYIIKHIEENHATNISTKNLETLSADANVLLNRIIDSLEATSIGPVLEKKYDKNDVSEQSEKEILSVVTPTVHSFIFIEVCLGLIVAVLIVFILLQFYNSNIFKLRRRIKNMPHLLNTIDSDSIA